MKKMTFEEFKNIIVNDIKEWLGHADISTTANIYAHISHRRKVSLAKSLEGSFTFEQSAETTA